jgi:Flp pilus assembly pilin Flp
MKTKNEIIKRAELSLKEPARRGPRKSLRKCETGLSTVEYIIILILVAVGGIGVWQKFGDTVEKQIKTATTKVKKMK